VDLLLVRHALPLRADGDGATADPALSDLGQQQAEATAAFLVGERIDAIVASPLRRAAETAQPLAERLGLRIDVAEGLREIDPFGGSYIPAEELTTDHAVVADMAEDPMVLFAGAGGFEQFRRTVVAAVDDIVAGNRGRRVAVFCHGSVIGTYLTAVLGHDDPFLLLPDYCGIYRVLASSDGLRTLRSANETGHVRDIAL
jgi:2,3-bisphosphoglycerate-dependent phosphoglycerate mutase